MGKLAATRRLDETEAQACLRGLRTSPRKLNLVAKTIRGKAAASALAELTFSHRRIARDVKKALEAAIANAEEAVLPRIVSATRLSLRGLVRTPRRQAWASVSSRRRGADGLPTLRPSALACHRRGRKRFALAQTPRACDRSCSR